MCTSCSVIKLHLTLISNVGGARGRKHTGGARHWTGWELLSQMGVLLGCKVSKSFLFLWLWMEFSLSGTLGNANTGEKSHIRHMMAVFSMTSLTLA